MRISDQETCASRSVREEQSIRRPNSRKRSGHQRHHRGAERLLEGAARAVIHKMPVSNDGGRTRRLLAGRSGRQRQADVLHTRLPAQDQQGKSDRLRTGKDAITQPLAGDADLPHGPSGDGRLGLRPEQDVRPELGHGVGAASDADVNGNFDAGTSAARHGHRLLAADRAAEVLAPDLAGAETSR